MVEEKLESKIKQVESTTVHRPFIISSAPGRADFLNTHQDYKGLPVVPIGINLRTYVFATQIIPSKFRIVSLDLKEQKARYIDEFDLNHLVLR